MNRQEAKQVLLAYRPGLEVDDPEVAQALKLAQDDPELSSWLDQHCAFQQALCAKFRQIIVPEGLAQQIISERKSYLNRQVQRKRVLLATACAALIVLAALFLIPHKADTFVLFRTRMATIVLREYPTMDLTNSSLAQIHQFLLQKQTNAEYTLPKGLGQSTPTGCAVVPWRQQSVSMICFNSGTLTPSDPDLFLFVVDSNAVPKAPPSKPRFAQLNILATVSWSTGGKTYVLAGYGDETFIRKFL